MQTVQMACIPPHTRIIGKLTTFVLGRLVVADRSLWPQEGGSLRKRKRRVDLVQVSSRLTKSDAVPSSVHGFILVVRLRTGGGDKYINTHPPSPVLKESPAKIVGPELLARSILKRREAFGI